MCLCVLPCLYISLEKVTLLKTLFPIDKPYIQISLFMITVYSDMYDNYLEVSTCNSNLFTESMFIFVFIYVIPVKHAL